MDKIEKNFFESYDSLEISLGEILRGERATLGKSYLDVQKDLKIKVNYIKAIEKCDISSLGNKSFIAGYVKTYARYLELDPDYVYQRFCDESGFESSKLNSFEIKKRINTKTENNNSFNSNFWRPGKFSQNKVNFSYASMNIFKKALPICSLFIVLFGVGYWIMLIILDLQRLEFIPIDQEPYSSVDLMKYNDEFPEFNDSNFEQKRLILDSLYSTSDTSFPIVQNRDSPIAKINPNSYGLFLKTDKMKNPLEIKKKLAVSNLSNERFLEEKKVVLRPRSPKLIIIALEKSWIRLKDQKGDIFLERNLSKGEEFLIPNELFSGSLRVGNSTKVFFDIDGIIFGPLSRDKSVIKNFSIDPLNIKNNLSFVSKSVDFFDVRNNKKIKALNTAKKID